MRLTIKKVVHLNADSNWKEPAFSFFDCDMSEFGYIPISEQDISIDIPDDFNPIPMQINNLKEQQQKIRAEAEAKAQAIDKQIQKLLAIEAPKNEAV